MAGGMYGTAGAQTRDVETLAPPIEPVSTVNQNTISILVDANHALGDLLAKVRGNQPEQGNAGNVEKMPERFVLADARALRDLAGQISDKVIDLHLYIGHDKQL